MSDRLSFSVSNLPRGGLVTGALCGAALVLGLGCAPGDPGTGDGGTPLTEWAGTASHFRATGTLNGEELDITLEGDDVTPTSLFCEREYTVPQDGAGNPDYANGKLNEVKLIAIVSVGDETREANVELKAHDLSADPIGGNVDVVPRDDVNELAANELTLEWEWKDEAGEDVFEKAAQTGTVTVEEFTGTPDETGLLIPDNTGTVGVFATAEWSETESLAISFTAPCAVNNVEIVE